MTKLSYHMHCMSYIRSSDDKIKLNHLQAHDIEWDSLMIHPFLVTVFDEVEEEY